MYNISQPTYNDDVRSRIGDDPENQCHNHRIDDSNQIGTQQPSSSEIRTISRKLGQESNGEMQTKPTISRKFGQESVCSSQVKTRQPKTRFSQPRSSETQTMQTRSSRQTKKNKGKTVERPPDNENESSSSETQTEPTISRKFGTQQPKPRFGQPKNNETQTMRTRSKKNKGKAVERPSDNENETIELDNC